jgi:hypothetical protein
MSDTANRQIPKSARKARSRLVLVVLFAMFLAPVLTALLAQTPWFHLHVVPTRNFGQLMQPVVPVGAGSIRQAAPETTAEAQWTMLYVPGATVEPDAKLVHLLQQIRLAQGRHIGRVRLERVEFGAEVASPEPWQVQRMTPEAARCCVTRRALTARSCAKI